MAALANFAQILAGMKRPSVVTPPFVPGARPRVYSPGAVAPPITPPALPGATPTGYPSAGVPPVLMGGIQPQEETPQGPLPVGAQPPGPQTGPVATPSPATPPNSGSVWTRLLAGLRNPANQAAMVTAGAAMTAPRQFGQTSWGQFNQALAQAYGAKQGYLYNQQQAQKSAQQQAFENDIKKREAAVKEQEAAARTTSAKAEETRSGAQAGLYGAQAKAIPDEIQIKRIEAETGKTNAEATLQHYQTMEANSSAQMDILVKQEERLNKALEETHRSNVQDERTRAYAAATERSLGEVRNRIAQQRADNEKAKMVMATEEGMRPVMISAYDNAAKFIQGSINPEIMNLPPEAKNELAKKMAISSFNAMIPHIPKRNPGAETARQQALKNPEPGSIPEPTEGQPVARTTGPNPPKTVGPSAATPAPDQLPPDVNPASLPQFVGPGGQKLVKYQGYYYPLD